MYHDVGFEYLARRALPVCRSMHLGVVVRGEVVIRILSSSMVGFGPSQSGGWRVYKKERWERASRQGKSERLNSSVIIAFLIPFYG